MKKTFLLVLFSFCFSYSQSEFTGYNQLILNKNYNLEMVPIKGGEFLMGSPLYEKNRRFTEYGGTLDEDACHDACPRHYCAAPVTIMVVPMSRAEQAG